MPYEEKVEGGSWLTCEEKLIRKVKYIYCVPLGAFQE